MRDNGLDPAALPRYEISDEASYFRAHLYDTHDIWHVVTGFHTDVAGELGLQAFYAAQIHGKVPLAILAGGMLNTFLYASEDHSARLSAIAEGWLLGSKARPLFGVDWDALWATPLAEVRERFGLPRSR
jgi:ubiquinone biosynthesis protein Coq4